MVFLWYFIIWIIESRFNIFCSAYVNVFCFCVDFKAIFIHLIANKSLEKNFLYDTLVLTPNNSFFLWLLQAFYFFFFFFFFFFFKKPVYNYLLLVEKVFSVSLIVLSLIDSFSFFRLINFFTYLIMFSLDRFLIFGYRGFFPPLCNLLTRFGLL